MSEDLNVRGASKEAISHHYDMGNDFFSIWLDKSLTYSAALYHENDTLESAQLRKLDYHLDKAKVKKDNFILDIGSGWGSLVKRAYETKKIKGAVGLTLSSQQKLYCDSLQLSDFEVRLEDWKNHEPNRKYDSIISIGAFEHFSRPELNEKQRIEVYNDFFKNCHSWLKEGAYMTLQTIAYGKANRNQINKFILDTIFPESDLPYLHEIILSLKGLFEVVELRNDGEHYARTFKSWRKNIIVNKSKISENFGKDIYEDYLKYSNLFLVGFHVGNMVLYRFTLKFI